MWDSEARTTFPAATVRIQLLFWNRDVLDVRRGQVVVHTNTQRGHVGGPASRRVAVALVGEAMDTHRLTKICCRQMGF